MSDLRERVARAICEAELGHDLLDQMVMTRENYLDAADAAIAAVFQWQPIETAPKNETILLLSPGSIYVGSYRDGMRGEPRQGERFWRADCCGRMASPTHWMPLPKRSCEQ